MAVETTLPVDSDVQILKYYSVTKGMQAMVNFEGSPSLLVLVNPSDGRRPYFYFQDRGFEDQIELGVHGE